MPTKKLKQNLKRPEVVNREEWLAKATELLAIDFNDHGAKFPKKLRFSVGFPGGHRVTKKAIGQHWHSKASSDGVQQIFVSPILEDPSEVLGVLVHELVHAVHPDDGHGKKFKELAIKVGLEGKMTATTVGKNLAVRLDDIADQVGKYPHGAISLREIEKKKQSTRLIKCECKDCGYIVRTTKKWIDSSGAPLCPCNDQPFVFEMEDEDEEEGE